jgi:hypothetical protein
MDSTPHPSLFAELTNEPIFSDFGTWQDQLQSTAEVQDQSQGTAEVQDQSQSTVSHSTKKICEHVFKYRENKGQRCTRRVFTDIYENITWDFCKKHLECVSTAEKMGLKLPFMIPIRPEKMKTRCEHLISVGPNTGLQCKYKKAVDSLYCIYHRHMKFHS